MVPLTYHRAPLGLMNYSSALVVQTVGSLDSRIPSRRLLHVKALSTLGLLFVYRGFGHL